MKPKHYKGLCRLCKKRKEAGNEKNQWVCKTWEECTSHPPVPTPGNFDIFEIWDLVTDCLETSGVGPSGFNILAVKEVVLLSGFEWNEDMLRRVKVLERIYLDEATRGD